MVLRHAGRNNHEYKKELEKVTRKCQSPTTTVLTLVGQENYNVLVSDLPRKHQLFPNSVQHS